jgi:hypothetical protein
MSRGMRHRLVEIISFPYLWTFSAIHLRQELYINVIKSMKQAVREARASGSNPDCKIINGGHAVRILTKRQQNTASQKIVYQNIGRAPFRVCLVIRRLS